MGGGGVSHDFYPRPPRGGRPERRPAGKYRHIHFYPRPPRGGRPGHPAPPTTEDKFLSTPSARRATWAGRPSGPASGYFYPRPPRGGRLRSVCPKADTAAFLSTPSARRATDALALAAVPPDISIHALREEGDGCTGIVKPMLSISIHALRKEGDATARPSYPRESHFYPRPPQGGRRIRYAPISVGKEFLSTPSARRATASRCAGVPLRKDFYPRPPRGGRRRW